MAKKRRNIYASLTIAIVIAMGAALANYARLNRQRVISTNRICLKDYTGLIAGRVSDELSQGSHNIEVLSDMVSELLSGPDFNLSYVQELLSNSVFDFVEFADKNGMDHTIIGTLTDARDRSYYINAKEGKSGTELVLNSRATHETLFDFYAPVSYKGEFVGSLIGVYQAANRMTRILQADFQGEKADSYMIMDDGRVLATSSGYDPNSNMLLADLAGGDEELMALMKETLRTGETTIFPLPGNPTGACLMKVPDRPYFIMQVFPQVVGDRMARRSSNLTWGLTVYLFILGIISVFVVTSEQRKRRYQLSMANKEAQEARLEAEKANKVKTDFFFNMSHDIRTPMNAIIGLTDLMKQHIDDRKLMLSYIEKIESANVFLMSLINNVLEMARIESGKETLDETPCSIMDIGGSLFSLLQPEVEKKHLILEHCAKVEHLNVIADATKIREILLNLFSNAIKYTPEGGRVRLDITELPCDQEGYGIYQSVIEDTGIGMSKEFLPHIFDDFSREKNTTSSKIAGTGLGMPIVKHLVELMHGTIEVESELGKGTCFTVTIPHRFASENELPDAVSADKAAKLLTLKGKRVLLAEDNDLNAEIAAELLEEAGMTVERAVDGVVCVDMLQKAAPDYYDLILMDIQMPFMDGYRATKLIRVMDDKTRANIPVVAMTANAFEEDKKNAFEAGMNGHIAKPINMTVVASELSAVLSTSRNSRDRDLSQRR